MHPLYYYFGTPDSDSADDTYDPTHECFNIDGAIASDSEDEATVGGRNMRLRSSSLLHEMRLNSLRTRECNSSKSVNCRTGSTRNEKICAYFNKPSSMSAWHVHMAKELERELATSIVASLRIGEGSRWQTRGGGE
jgi:hypothetical protein